MQEDLYLLWISQVEKKRLHYTKLQSHSSKDTPHFNMVVNKKCHSNQYLGSEEVCNEHEIRPLHTDASEILELPLPLGTISNAQISIRIYRAWSSPWWQAIFWS